MKSYTRKTLAIFLGLAMGWYVAGLSSTFAADGHEEAAKHVEESVHAEHNDHAVEDSHAEDGHSSEADGHGDGHDNADAAAAKQLVPGDVTHDIAWYPKVIYTIIGLFVVAILVGLVGKSKGVREPGVLASEEDAEQAHGADEEDSHH